jgi:hypothetical protein
LYPDWTTTQKDDLARMYAEIRNRRFPRAGVRGLRPVPPSPLPEAPTPSALDTSNNNLGTIFDDATAWRYFLAYIAHSLLVEIYQLVPWSLTDLSEAELYEVLTPIGLFEYRGRTTNDYRLEYAATPGDPLHVSQFIFTNAFIGADQRQTIGRLLDWCRGLRHFRGTYDAATAMEHWQYNGWPPVERVIAGTTHPQYGFGHWTTGCGGTTSFLKLVLRTVNIAIEAASGGGHTMPHFMHDNLYLSHGDDPYSYGLVTTPPIPIDELFIDQNTFTAWFDPNLPLQTRQDNVARQVAELALKYLTNSLLRLRCQDMANGITIEADSAVYKSYLSKYYTVSQLQAQNLWPRLDAKIAAMGGCGNIP